MKFDLQLRYRWSHDDRVSEMEPILFALLAAIGRGDNLRTAASDAGISYRHAWGLLVRWGRRFEAPLVVMARGRGSRLTPLGEALVNGERLARERLAPLLDQAAGELEQRLMAVQGVGQDRLRIDGSHDLVLRELCTLLQRRAVNLVLRFCGSFEGLRRLEAGDCDLAGFHLPEGELGQVITKQYQDFAGQGWQLLRLVRRRQGLITAPGNPKGIKAIGDLGRPGVRIVNRQPGSGTRLAMDILLGQSGCTADDIDGYENEEYTHSAVAALVASGAADVGLGLEAAAARFDLNFIPMFDEVYYFAVKSEILQTPAVRALTASLKSRQFQAIVANYSGYRGFDSDQVLPAETVLG